MRRRKRIIGIVALALIVLIGLPSVSIWRAYRQEKLNRTLIAAIKRQDTESALASLEAGANANIRDDGKQTASFREILQRFWDNLHGGQKQIPAKNLEEKRLTPLMLLLSAPSVGNPSSRENTILMQALLKHGANPNVRDEEGLTPLHLAVDLHYAACVRILLEHYADPNAREEKIQAPPLYWADPACTRLLLEHEAKTELTYLSGETPLLADCQNPEYEGSIPILLQYGASVNAHDIEGYTPLHRAAEHLSLDTIKMLLARGADIRARTKKGETELMCGAYCGKPEVVRFLLQQGLDVNARNVNGTTALMYSIKGRNSPVIQLLLEKGAGPNLQGIIEAGESDFDGTPLMFAAWLGDKATTKLLLKYGADINARNAEGDTALKNAMEQGNTEIVRFLKSHGAKE